MQTPIITSTSTNPHDYPPIPAVSDSRNACVRPTNYSDEITSLRTPEVCVDLAFNPSEGLFFVISPRGQGTQLSPTYETFRPLTILKPLAANGSLLLPSRPIPHGSLTVLANEFRTFIRRYFDCDEMFESVCVLFALHTWVYERFHAVPYLRFLGSPEHGKTRASDTISALCYHSFILPASQTAAVLFRVNDAVGGTLVVDEADYEHSEIGQEIIKILNAGYQRGALIQRMESGREGMTIRSFNVFGPKIIGGRQPFKDSATETRCLTHRPQLTNRTDIPFQLPDEFFKDAVDLRSKALAWRLVAFDAIDTQKLPYQLPPVLSARSKQITLPLLAIVDHIEDTGERSRYLKDLVSFMTTRELVTTEERRGTVESYLVTAFVNAGPAPTCKALRDSVISAERESDPKVLELTPKKVGAILNEMGFTTEKKSQGAVVSVI